MLAQKVLASYHIGAAWRKQVFPCMTFGARYTWIPPWKIRRPPVYLRLESRKVAILFFTNCLPSCYDFPKSEAQPDQNGVAYKKMCSLKI